MTEDYYEAAIRHFVDAGILQQGECYDNAVCLLGFSAECALKALIETYCGDNRREILQKKYGHKGEALFGDLYHFIANSSMVSALDPALGLKLYDYVLPDVLFQEHPDRRYAKSGRFSSSEVEACREAVGYLIRAMISQRIDGYI